MKFLSVRDLKEKSSQIWKELPGQKEMVLTNNGRPIAVLSAVNEENLEQVLAAFRRSRAVAATTALQYASTAKGTSGLSTKEIDEEIAAVRRQRKS